MKKPRDPTNRKERDPRTDHNGYRHNPRNPTRQIVHSVLSPGHTDRSYPSHDLVTGSLKRQVEQDPAELVEQHGADTPVLYWRERLVCSTCRSRQIDMVVTGNRRQSDG